MLRFSLASCLLVLTLVPARADMVIDDFSSNPPGRTTISFEGPISTTGALSGSDNLISRVRYAFSPSLDLTSLQLVRLSGVTTVGSFSTTVAINNGAASIARQSNSLTDSILNFDFSSFTGLGSINDLSVTFLSTQSDPTDSSFSLDRIEAVPVPEPTSLLMTSAAGLCCLLWYRRRPVVAA